MLIDFNKCIALKGHNGEYNLEYINLFLMKEPQFKFQNIDIKLVKNKKVNFKIYCPICERYHFYDYDIKEIIKRNMILGGCEELNIPIFYIGNVELIKSKVEKLTRINNKFNFIFFQSDIVSNHYL